MKPAPFHLNSQCFAFIIILIVIIFSSCAGAGKAESPFVFGYAINTMPGIKLGEGKSSIHAVLGYTRFNFGGGNTNLFQLGLQYRHPLENSSAEGIWVGGELCFISVSNKYVYNSDKPTASGFVLGPVLGDRLQIGNFPLNIYMAVDYIHRGQFNLNGQLYAGPGNGFYSRIGFDIPFMTFLMPNGK